MFDDGQHMDSLPDVNGLSNDAQRAFEAAVWVLQNPDKLNTTAGIMIRDIIHARDVKDDFQHLKEHFDEEHSRALSREGLEDELRELHDDIEEYQKSI